MPASPTLCHPKSSQRIYRARNRSRESRVHRPTTNRKLRHHMQKRQLKIQEALNLEECSNDCENRGFHWDTDVRIGNHVNPNENRYSLLLSPASPSPIATENTFEIPSAIDSDLLRGISTVHSDFSHLTDETNVTSNIVGNQVPDDMEMISSVNVPSSEYLVHGHPSINSSYRLSGSNIVQTPLDSLLHFDGQMQYHIPSPLLYHRRSSEITTDLTVDESDFDLDTRIVEKWYPEMSYQMAHSNKEAKKDGDVDDLSGNLNREHCSIAKALPLMEQDAQQTIVDGSVPSEDLFDLQPFLPQLVRQSYSKLNEPSTAVVDETTTFNLLRKNTESDVSKRRPMNDFQLAFPVLPNPLRQIPDDSRSSNKCAQLHLIQRYQQNGKDTYEEDADMRMRLWTEFERAVRRPNSLPSYLPGSIVEAFDSYSKDRPKSSSTLCAEKSVFSHDAESNESHIRKISVCSAPHCLALVATSTSQRVSHTDLKTISTANEYNTTVTASVSNSFQEDSHTTDPLLEWWSKDLGLTSKHVEDCAKGSPEPSRNFTTDDNCIVIEPKSFTSTPILVLHPQHTERLEISSPITQPSMIVDDEGYYTAYDDLSDLGRSDSDTVLEYWESFDEDSEAEDEIKIGLFACGY